MNALIVDDNPGNLEALAALLRREGINPTALSSPRDLPGILDEFGCFDLIFLDLEFPTCSGLDVVGQLLSDSRLCHTPIIAYTVHISEQNEARAAGFHSFLGKPLNVQRFPGQLQRILQGEPVWEI